MGARRFTFGLASLRLDRNRRGHRRDPRAQSLQHRLRNARRVCGSRRARRPTGPAIGASSSAATARSPIPRRSPRAAPCRRKRRGSRSLRGNAHQDRTAAGRLRRSRLPARRGGERGRSARPDRRYRAADLEPSKPTIARKWEEILGAVVVKTPDRAMDIMLNGWLLYQTLSLPRLGARRLLSGERRLRISRPAAGRHGARRRAAALTREHLLRAAARQFAEGDVQHWWLPHSGQGVRTRISDDRHGWPSRSPSTSRPQPTSRCSTKRSRSSRAMRWSRRARQFLMPTSPTDRRRCSSIARSPSTPASRWARTGFR